MRLGNVWTGLAERDFCNQIHETATRVAISQHRHVLEWHARQVEAETAAHA